MIVQILVSVRALSFVLAELVYTRRLYTKLSSRRIAPIAFKTYFELSLI
jgi:hypothetical protein